MLNLKSLDLPTDKLFRIRVPDIALYSIEEIEVYGTRLDDYKDFSSDHLGNRWYNKETQNQSYYKYTIAEVNIKKLLEIYSFGYTFYMVKKEELKELYTILDNYIKNIVSIKNRSINKIDSDNEFIMYADQFLSEIYKHNKYTLVNEENGLKDYTLNLDLINPIVAQDKFNGNKINDIDVTVEYDNFGRRVTRVNSINNNRINSGNTLTEFYLQNTPQSSNNPPNERISPLKEKE